MSVRFPYIWPIEMKTPEPLLRRLHVSSVETGSRLGCGATRSFLRRLRLHSLVVFDFDDTCVDTAPLYTRARAQCREIVAADGVDPAQWNALQQKCDAALIPTLKFGPAQFPTACVEAYEALAKSPKPSVSKKLYATASAVLTNPPPVKAGVDKALAELSRDHIMVLLTKGNSEVQERLVRASGLGGRFDKVVMVGDKNPEAFREICRWAHVAPERAWSVGNSLPSDINPAMRAGLSTVHFKDGADVWTYEQRETKPLPGGRYSSTDRMAKVPAIIHKGLG